MTDPTPHLLTAEQCQFGNFERPTRYSTKWLPGPHKWVERKRHYGSHQIEYRCTNGDTAVMGPCKERMYRPFEPVPSTPQSRLMDEYISGLPTLPDGRLDLSCPACQEVVNEARAILARLRASTPTDKAAIAASKEPKT